LHWNWSLDSSALGIALKPDLNLFSSTIAADSPGLVGETGAIARAHYAGTIAVAGDPLHGVSALTDVILVTQGGKIYLAPG
jgi:hypothetical protein